ncbi:hypothetical protein CERSUDRAFT_102598 [Gelatoporia subvermispora B]|uniref:Uncharacterized protein n=1 Tax=Ceriporiopsis subvermispora (strain B) TaxID=914234 RepID=M2RCR3_CERS8|nr:hypothetical protein CERSUDRAFT_102598 [Gelatoporia subvermispora B]
MDADDPSDVDGPGAIALSPESTGELQYTARDYASWGKSIVNLPVPPVHSDDRLRGVRGLNSSQSARLPVGDEDDVVRPHEKAGLQNTEPDGHPHTSDVEDTTTVDEASSQQPRRPPSTLTVTFPVLPSWYTTQSRSASPNPPTRSSSHSLSLSSRESEHKDEILAFLNNLTERTGSLLTVFKKLGFKTTRHLDALCTRSDARRERFMYMLREEYDVSYADCILIEDGLDRRRGCL